MGGKIGSAPACYGSTLGSNPDISKIQNGQQTHSSPPKNIQKIKTDTLSPRYQLLHT